LFFCWKKKGFTLVFTVDGAVLDPEKAAAGNTPHAAMATTTSNNGNEAHLMVMQNMNKK
jgi:hypothetical protein